MATASPFTVLSSRFREDAIARLRAVVFPALFQLPSDATEEELRSKVLVPMLREGLRIRDYDIRLERHIPEEGRADLVVEINKKPMVVIECKRPSMKLNLKRERDAALSQAERYARGLHSPCVLITNGDLWVLAIGRQQTLLAESRSVFFDMLPEFFYYMRPYSLWPRATGLYPPDGMPEIYDLLARCYQLNASESDLKIIDRLFPSLPSLAPRLAELVRKALAIRTLAEQHRVVNGSDPGLAIAHVDNTLVTPRASAWDYDIFNQINRCNEESLRNSTPALQVDDALVRVLMTDPNPTERQIFQAFSVSKDLLREGCAVGILPAELVSSYGLPAMDIVGNAITREHSPNEAYEYRWERDPKKASEYRSRIRSLMKDHGERFVAPSHKDRLTALEEVIGRV